MNPRRHPFLIARARNKPYTHSFQVRPGSWEHWLAACLPDWLVAWLAGCPKGNSGPLDSCCTRCRHNRSRFVPDSFRIWEQEFGSQLAGKLIGWPLLLADELLAWPLARGPRPAALALAPSWVRSIMISRANQ